MKRRNELTSRFKIWESLLDTSGIFVLAGLRARGFSEERSLTKLRQIWIKSSQEHQQANLEIINKLYARKNNTNK